MRITLVVVAFMAYISFVFGQREDFTFVSFTKPDSVAKVYESYSINNIPVLAEKLTSPFSTEVEKFRALYTWTCLNIKNDYGLFLKNQRKRKKLSHSPEALKKWNRKFSIEVFEILRKKNRTICTGYAYILRELALQAGISCKIVDGYGRTAMTNIGEPGMPNHSWNSVKLNNKWYLCDPTWSSGAIELNVKKFIQQYDDIYFLLDPVLFVRNHYPLDTAHLFLKDRPSLTDFLTRPLIYKEIFTLTIFELQPEKFEFEAVRGKPVKFKLTTTKQSIKNAELEIVSNTIERTPVNLQFENETFSFEHSFQSSGTFTLHLFINDSRVATYLVHVKKNYH